MTPIKKHSIAAAPGTSFTKKQVYLLSKHFVYPPCKKQEGDIRIADDLAQDLGYVGNAKRLLAPKSNNTFALEPPNSFTGPEMEKLTTVQSHVDATCKKLKDAGRLLP